jgi:hypothetical protein
MNVPLCKKAVLYGMGVFLTLCAGCYIDSTIFKAKARRTVELTAPLADVTALDCSTNVGDIRLEAGDVTEAHVTAEITVKARRQEDADRLVQDVEITAETRGRTLFIQPIRPAGFGRNELGVNFRIVAPAALALDCSTNVGDIRTVDFASSTEARTDVGSITCTGLRGAADLHTNVGDIKAVYMPDAPAAMSVDLYTNVGSIEFAGPTEMSANLRAEANVGSISTGRPLSVTGQIKNSLNASLGSAEGQIRLRANVGSITIR